MAKRQTRVNRPLKKKEKVKCTDCKFSPGDPVNHLVDCVNELANPNGYKKGCWEHFCEYFESK